MGKVNTIYFSKRYELRDDYYVIPFSCSDLMNVNTEVSYRDRQEYQQKVIDSVVNRITLALQERGYEVVSISFWSMLISAVKSEVENV